MARNTSARKLSNNLQRELTMNKVNLSSPKSPVQFASNKQVINGLVQNKYGKINIVLNVLFTFYFLSTNNGKERVGCCVSNNNKYGTLFFTLADKTKARLHSRRCCLC